MQMSVLPGSTGSQTEFWESLLEVSPQLGTCRLLLQRRRQFVDGGPQGEAALDHLGWTARLNVQYGRLQVMLLPPPPSPGGSAATATSSSATSVIVGCGDGVEIRADGLQCQADHLTVSLVLKTSSRWLAELFAPSLAEQQQALGSLLCRSCGQELLLPGVPELQVFLLPTNMWQACADIMACEECAPLGVKHISTTPGRLYMSPQCLLLSASDLRPGTVSFGTDGLVRCSCSSVIGESQAGPPQAPASTRRPRRSQKRLFCKEAWKAGAACRGRGLALYKHRVSMPVHHTMLSVADTASSNAGSTPGVVAATTSSRGGSLVEDSPKDALQSHTEAAAVGGELLQFKNTLGVARFLLLPSPPEQEASGAERAAMEVENEALEVRIVMSELAVVGPEVHNGDAVSLQEQLGCLGPQRRRPGPGAEPQRVAKVYYRRRPCTAPQVEGQIVVVPLLSFTAVCDALDGWAAALPESHLKAPVSDKDGLGRWQTSFLPLPPRDGGVE